MSLPLSKFEWWESGTNQNSVPANNNALRTMISMRAAVSDSVTAQPSLSTPADDGTWYVIPAGATGTFWSTFDENSCAIFYGGAWYEFVPEDGDVVTIAGVLYEFSVSSGWVEIAGGGGGEGDVTGPGSSTDNALARFDGTSGKTLQNSGEISGYAANINAQTGTTYTLQASDAGKLVRLTNASPITLTLPNSLGANFCCSILQGGAGQVTLSAASGATLRNRQSHTKLAGTWAWASIVVVSNSGGSAAEYVLAGDTTA
jgi:hypothetical protein